MTNELIDYANFEKNFKVAYPETKNATYISQVNFSDDLNKPFQQWYRYKEGFSIELVKNLIIRQTNKTNGVILDPFSGSGSTLIAANELGFKGIGFEVNPFSYFLSKVKLTNYSSQEVKEFEELFNQVLLQSNDEYPLPKLSFAERVFDDQVRSKLMQIKKNIINLKNKINPKVFNLLKLGWLSSVEELSTYRKAGNGLKRRNLKNPVLLDEEDVVLFLKNLYTIMHTDLLNHNHDRDIELYKKTSLNMGAKLEDESITGIIFSPPYANCFDYTEIYKLELWFGDFIAEYRDLRRLRDASLRSHLSANLDEDADELYTLPLLEQVIKEISKKELWDNRIPRMLQLYFHDMFRIIETCYTLLENSGFCNIVVSNSAYGGIIVPTDILFAQYAKKIGFEIDVIEVARYIIPSSQQYKITRNQKKYLRESVICLKKSN